MEVALKLWVQHLLQSPQARDDFITHLEQLKQICYKRALDEDDSDISRLQGEKDSYIQLQAYIQRGMQHLVTDDVLATLFPMR